MAAFLDTNGLSRYTARMIEKVGGVSIGVKFVDHKGLGNNTFTIINPFGDKLLYVVCDSLSDTANTDSIQFCWTGGTLNAIGHRRTGADTVHVPVTVEKSGDYVKITSDNKFLDVNGMMYRFIFIGLP